MDEIIDDYTCDKCKHKSSKHRKQYIEYAPDVLLIQLKRFDYTGRKDIGKVVFEHTIDLSRYARSGIGGLKYKLASVIDHYGNTNWGHYTATVNVHRQEWVEFDDDNTHPLDPVEALTAAARFTPYLLFYKRDLEHRG
jgi:ubiquitin C-terminal hydrolase